MVTLIIISCILAALTPAITKKLKSQNIIIGASSNSNSSIEFLSDCSKYSSDCTLCTTSGCSLCLKECATGEFKNNSDCICQTCSDLFSNCIECDSKNCTKCTEGYGVENKNCALCKEGYFDDRSGVCAPCPKGKYQNKEGQTSCIDCEITKYQNQTGQSSCTICEDGTYQDETGQSVCKDCEEDNYCINGAKTACEKGYGANVKSSQCESCADKIAYCEECTNLSTCTKCSAGFYLQDGICIPCEAGYYSADGVNKTACGAGKNSNSGATTCYSCPSNCNTCSSASVCTECKSGYTLSGGSCATSCSVANCATCASGSTTVCKTCKSGYHAVDFGNGSLKLCVKDVVGCTGLSVTSSCTQCDSGGCIEYVDGYYSDSYLVSYSGCCRIAPTEALCRTFCEKRGLTYHVFAHYTKKMNKTDCANYTTTGTESGSCLCKENGATRIYYSTDYPDEIYGTPRVASSYCN